MIKIISSILTYIMLFYIAIGFILEVIKIIKPKKITTK